MAYFSILINENSNIPTVKAMMKDKRTDLDGEKQKRLLLRLVAEMSQTDTDLYYHPTSAIAQKLSEHVSKAPGLSSDERSLLTGLGWRDIQILLSMN
ncbi:hypothetical protein [Aliiruegeria lutimaris]|uniref:Uncharacterized protein n=1 Tax=Aliiruegeria lutimaris TaxID=571298 RepID=A0A1G9K7R4_9RHOB|nr:hypothetical protein [Aliiruegeria lutimaris]SDL45425.1 hypothetical protein SAMN04488026_108616 [Aliiruegeria lutimaris]